jgi:crotonobetainyl-CoA:carnitine CoA-transferase CaiB-like acyl-CoA transferase
VARARGLVQLLVDAFAADDRDSWLEKLRAEDIVCAPVQDYADVERDPQVLANDLIVELEHPQFGRFRQVGIPVKLSATPGAVTTTAPEHGQHTEEVLLASGYTWDDIRALRGKGAI